MAVWHIGETRAITWASTGDILSGVLIELSRDNGGTWATLAAAAPDTGSYAWTVTGPVSATCLIRRTGGVYTNPDGSTVDYSDMTFTGGQFEIGAAIPSLARRPSMRLAVSLAV